MWPLYHLAGFDKLEKGVFLQVKVVGFKLVVSYEVRGSLS